jgi:Transposase, Mutator family
VRKNRTASASIGYSSLVDTIGATLPGASWQRCRTHTLLRNLLAKVPKSARPWEWWLTPALTRGEGVRRSPVPRVG